MEERRQRAEQQQTLEQQREELQIEQEHLQQLKQELEQRDNDLKMREAEMAPFIPSVKQLQNAGIDFNSLMSYMVTINQKAALRNVSLKVAAYELAQELKRYEELGGIQRVIKNAESQLEMIGPYYH